MEDLHWEIEPKSRRYKNVALTFSFGLFIILSLPSRALTRYSFVKSGESIFTLILTAVVPWLLLLAYFSLRPYYKRYYIINNQGITVTNGKNTGSFLWSEFEVFYPRSEFGDREVDLEHKKELLHRNQNSKHEFEEIARIKDSQTGKTFYVKLKPRSFFDKIQKTFLVIYTLPDNQNNVKDSIAKYIPMGAQSAWATDLGFRKRLFL